MDEMFIGENTRALAGPAAAEEERESASAAPEKPQGFPERAAPESAPESAPEESRAEDPPEAPVQTETGRAGGSGRDYERDKAFARMRREAEAARREAAVLRAAMERAGITGPPEHVADRVVAMATGKTEAEARAEREAANAERKAVEEVRLLKEELRERYFKDDMALLKKAHPEVTAAHPSELGEDFLRLRASGVDPVVAYEAIRLSEESKKTPPPPTPGSMKTGGGAESRDYFTEEELGRLTDKQLDNPKILEKALKSLSRKKGGA